MSKKPAAAKPAKIKEGIEDIVMQWFKEKNRPTTTQGVVDALGSRVAKPACQKALDLLVEQQLLLVKEVKKAKYYYLDQAKLAAQTQQQEAVTTASEGENVEASEAEQALAALRDQFVSMSKEAQSRAAHLAQLLQRRSRADTQTVLENLREEFSAAQSRLSALEGSNSVSFDWALLTKQYTALRSVWRSRKEVCDCIVDAVSGDGPRDVLIEAAGVVTDAEANVSWEDTAVNLKKRTR